MRVPQPGLLCGHCGLPVLHHTDRVKEMAPGPDGTLRMQLYHAKRCWPRERRKRAKEKRRMERERDTVTPTPPQSQLQIVPSIAKSEQRRSGVGRAVYNILDHIPQGQEWSIDEIIQRMGVYNITTTRGSVTQTAYTYKAHRRKTHTVRVESNGRRVFVFDEPPPTEPIGTISYHKGGRKVEPVPKKMRISKAAQAEITRQLIEDRPVPAPPSLQTA